MVSFRPASGDSVGSAGREISPGFVFSKLDGSELASRRAIRGRSTYQKNMKMRSDTAAAQPIVMPTMAPVDMGSELEDAVEVDSTPDPIQCAK